MGWPKLHENERGATVWRIFWEAGFLPRPVDASFGMGGLNGSKMTKVPTVVGCVAQSRVVGGPFCFTRICTRFIYCWWGAARRVVCLFVSRWPMCCSGRGDGGAACDSGIKMRPHRAFPASGNESKVRERTTESILLLPAW